MASPEDPLNGGDVDSAMLFSEKTIRHGFIKKVYAILLVQLAITGGLIAAFLYAPGVKEYSWEHPEMMYSAIIITFVLVIVLACCAGVRRKTPWNFIFLFIFTLAEAYLLGSITCFYDADEVLIAVGICVAVCVGITIFAFQTKWDFTMCGGLVFAAAIVLIMFGILALCMPYSRTLNMMYAALGALIFSFYLVFDTQLMIGGSHKYSVSPEEYIFAALNLYLDVINLFLMILTLVGRK